MTGKQIMRHVPMAMLLFYMANALLIAPAYTAFRQILHLAACPDLPSRL